MRARLAKCSIFFIFCGMLCVQNLAAAYFPLSIYESSAFASWEALREASATPAAEGRRPVLPGVNGKDLELLQDAIANKWPKKVPGGTLPAARAEVARITPFRLPAVRGYMAEAIYLDNNPEWKYVNKPNATQHDVYKSATNGTPRVSNLPSNTGQVKFHMDGKAARYARDMRKDFRSDSFIIPDDHVDGLKAHLKYKAKELRLKGDEAGAATLDRQVIRVKGIGATSTQIDRATRQAITEARVVRVAPYVFVGVATTLMTAPTVMDWYKGDIDGQEALYRLAKSGSTIGSTVVADQALKNWRGGLLRGTLRGNVLTACVVLMVDTSWRIYECGGVGNALQDPEFIISMGGNVSATGLAIAGGYVGMKTGAAIGGLVGPKGATIGGATGGLAVGTAAGVAGYFGGAKGTRWALEKFSPEKLYAQERAYVGEVRKGIEDSIAELQSM